MLTVIETPEFQKQAARVWNDTEHDDFIAWIAVNYMDGDAIPGAEGARKVRYAASGRGKRGGARVIYFNVLSDGEIYLLAVYAKADQENISTKTVKGAKRGAQKR